MIKEYKNNFKQQIHDIINCWIYNIEDTLSDDIIDLTNTILIVTNKFDIVIKKAGLLKCKPANKIKINKNTYLGIEEIILRIS